MARGAGETSFANLRSAPAVLVGGFNNQWFMRLTGQLRFSDEGDRTTGLYWIQDRQNPSERSLTVDVSATHTTFADGYGIIMQLAGTTSESVF